MESTLNGNRRHALYSISGDAIRWFLFALLALTIVWAGRRFIASAAMALSSFSVVTNSLRLRRLKLA